jgi:hypothetical protein
MLVEERLERHMPEMLCWGACARKSRAVQQHVWAGNVAAAATALLNSSITGAVAALVPIASA